MENYNISDSQITASSQYDEQHAAGNARLNFNPVGSPLAGAWCAASNVAHQQWLQVDFEEKVPVTQVATQGRFYDGSGQKSKQWVKTFSLSYSRNGTLFKDYEQLGNVKVIWDFISTRWCKVHVTCCLNDMIFRNASKVLRKWIFIWTFSGPAKFISGRKVAPFNNPVIWVVSFYSLHSGRFSPATE